MNPIYESAFRELINFEKRLMPYLHESIFLEESQVETFQILANFLLSENEISNDNVRNLVESYIETNKYYRVDDKKSYDLNSMISDYDKMTHNFIEINSKLKNEFDEIVRKANSKPIFGHAISKSTIIKFVEVFKGFQYTRETILNALTVIAFFKLELPFFTKNQKLSIFNSLGNNLTYIPSTFEAIKFIEAFSKFLIYRS